MRYATGHNSFTSQYLLDIYIYCRLCRLCKINLRKKIIVLPCSKNEFLWNRILHVRFEVFTAVTMKNTVFWGVAPCRCSGLNRRFGGTYCLHLQGRKIRERRTSHLLTLVPRSRIFLRWRWRRYVPPKRWFTQDLHGATSHKTAFFNNNYLH
jgi:hypothetical protein